MKQQVEVKTDLLKVTWLLMVIVGILISLKMYDAKTNEVGKIGEFILKNYVN